MKTIRTLVLQEVRSSMLYLGLAILACVGVVFAFNTLGDLKSDIYRTERFISEATKNVLLLEQPILLQRSISEFWEASNIRESSLIGVEINSDNTLIAQVGVQQSKNVFETKYKRCVNVSSLKNFCVIYRIDILKPFYTFLFLILVTTLFALATYSFRRNIALKNIGALITPLEKEILKISELSLTLTENHSDLKFEDLISVHLSSQIIDLEEVAKLYDAYKMLLQHSQSYMETRKNNEITNSVNLLARQVAHDIRSPLTALKTLSKISASFSNQEKEMIVSVTQRISDIADDLLQKTKIQNQHLPTSTTLTENNCLAEQAITKAISQKKIEFLNSVVSIKYRTLITQDTIISISENNLGRILSNLINNSVEAIIENGEIIVESSIQDRALLITITDFGRGIPEDVLNKLKTSPLSYGKNSNMNTSGSGLGIYGSNQIVEEAGGYISIISKEGVGTQVAISIPIK